jgi:hypothetical protein
MKANTKDDITKAFPDMLCPLVVDFRKGDQKAQKGLNVYEPHWAK